MKKYFKVLEKVPLFKGVEKELDAVLSCLLSSVKAYKKDSIIFLAGEPIHAIGIILSGSAKIIKEGIDGNVNILTELVPGDTFGEAFVCASMPKIFVTVQAQHNCEVLFINYKKMITPCAAACDFHTKLIENMMKIIAMKNIVLNQKIEIMSKRSIREKLLCYFEIQRETGNSNQFTIPFNRMELAEFICVDRSAMSRELSKMRDEGLIEFEKNFFKLL